MQENLGGISSYQVQSVLAAGLLTIGSGLSTQSSSILSAIPDFRQGLSKRFTSILILYSNAKRWCLYGMTGPITVRFPQK